MNWKTGLTGMKPYTPGRSIEDVQTLYGLKEVVKLASNENPYGCSPAVKAFLESNTIQHEIYPDGNAGNLRNKLSKKHNVPKEMLLFGNGSDEIIMIISRALLGEGSNTVMPSPSFPQYAHNAKIEGAEIREVPLVNGQHDLNGFMDAMDSNTAVIWLCSPNNPTGNIIPANELKTFLKKIPDDILVVLDEAYYEYVTASDHIDSVTLLNDFANVIVLRTFSKAYGLAAFRVGYAIGNPAIISYLNTVRSPFNNNSFGVAVAERALDDEAFIEKCRELNSEQRNRFKNYAIENGIHMFDSQTNFVLIEVPDDADDAAESLLRHGFIVRSGNVLGTPGYVRVTIGTEAQNSNFFKAFDLLLNSQEIRI
ncbi:histidinol-phosphate transaminase [Filibacter tadaridae]|uniref:Histidinol-phosphate aminotransferase n=1 Tax=Filibacter tadaridae TaxID=2483811 RepID=A0A3P5XD04_9BACL|nr:histidinol-phosphate transaminase [Filibacter tadaridae]VDC29215.1 Histidinol-phosphate aminotransferase [Filibacter tadaridae]